MNVILLRVVAAARDATRSLPVLLFGSLRRIYGTLAKVRGANEKEIGRDF